MLTAFVKPSLTVKPKIRFRCIQRQGVHEKLVPMFQFEGCTCGNGGAALVLCNHIYAHGETSNSVQMHTAAVRTSKVGFNASVCGLHLWQRCCGVGAVQSHLCSR